MAALAAGVGDGPIGAGGPSPYDVCQVRAQQVRAGQVRAPQVRTGQVRGEEFRTGQVRTGQVRAGQGRAVQVRLGQFRAGQVRAGQVRASQVRVGQVCARVDRIPLHYPACLHEQNPTPNAGGWCVETLRRLLGHASVATTGRYLDHLTMAELRAALAPLPVLGPST